MASTNLHGGAVPPRTPLGMSRPRPVAQPQNFQYPPPASQGARVSSRASYPTFLSLPETAILQLTWAWKGLCDAFRWNAVISTITSDAEIRANALKSLLLNSLSLLSIYIFDLLLQPLVQDQQKWFHRNIGWFYQVLWLGPVVGMSLYLNGTWCTTIAKRTYLLQHGGRPVASQPMSYTGMLTAIATSAYRVVMVCTSVVLSFTLSKVPLIGPVASFIFFCWVDAYYCFEFVWIARGLSLSSRIRYLEERWAYFFAFGLPSTALCMWGSTMANAAIFALVFPVFIIMAMNAKPIPQDPYNPTPPAVNARQEDADIIRHPSPFVPIRLPIFAVVIVINDAIVRVLNSIGGRPPVRHKAAARNRAFSDASESAEGGSARIPLQSLGAKGSGSGASTIPSQQSSKRPTTTRVNIGERRKAD